MCHYQTELLMRVHKIMQMELKLSTYVENCHDIGINIEFLKVEVCDIRLYNIYVIRNAYIIL